MKKRNCEICAIFQHPKLCNFPAPEIVQFSSTTHPPQNTYHLLDIKRAPSYSNTRSEIGHLTRRRMRRHGTSVLPNQNAPQTKNTHPFACKPSTPARTERTPAGFNKNLLAPDIEHTQTQRGPNASPKRCAGSTTQALACSIERAVGVAFSDLGLTTPATLPFSVWDWPGQQRCFW
jgi:hypothetical protein